MATKMNRLPKYQVGAKVSPNFDIDFPYLTVVWVRSDKKLNIYKYWFLEMGMSCTESILKEYDGA